MQPVAPAQCGALVEAASPCQAADEACTPQHAPLRILRPHAAGHALLAKPEHLVAEVDLRRFHVRHAEPAPPWCRRGSPLLVLPLARLGRGDTLAHRDLNVYLESSTTPQPGTRQALGMSALHGAVGEPLPCAPLRSMAPVGAAQAAGGGVVAHDARPQRGRGCARTALGCAARYAGEARAAATATARNGAKCGQATPGGVAHGRGGRCDLPSARGGFLPRRAWHASRYDTLLRAPLDTAVGITPAPPPPGRRAGGAARGATGSGAAEAP